MSTKTLRTTTYIINKPPKHSTLLLCEPPSCAAKNSCVAAMHTDNPHRMFSHVVIFWTDPAQPNAVAELIAGANQYLKPIPGVIQFHVGKMVGSHRPVVDRFRYGGCRH